MAPGDQLLPERQLAETIGVSRSALREGLSALASMGMIEIRPWGGAYVRAASLESLAEPLATVFLTKEVSVLHLLEVRKILETQIAAIATERADSVDLERIRENVVRTQEDISAHQVADDSDTNFHLSLAEATHNPVLIKMMSMLSGLMREAYGPSRRIVLSVPEKAEIFAEHHRRIYEAIKNRKPREASKVILEHLSMVERELEARINEMQSAPGPSPQGKGGDVENPWSS
ncbi:MAG: FadR family transcriptional regulator [Actinobacteria bacterium]|nr:FadR family transcriptional regulator [Actinomycetota bacterium]